MAKLSGRPLLSTSDDKALLVQRVAELDLIIDAVGRGLNVLLHGERGSGLTTTLHQVMRRAMLDDLAHPRFSNAASVTGAEDLVHQIVGDVGPTVAVVGGTSAYSRFARYADLPPGIVGIVDNAPVRVLRELFGQHRDEVWAVPMSWVVACPEQDRAAVLEPPVDSFFDVVVGLDPLTDVQSASLLRRRTSKSELPPPALRAVVQAAGGNPRRLIRLARTLVLGEGDPTSLSRAAADRAEVESRLSRPAQMLLAEIVARGPSSASDVRLQEATGWTRSRLVQLFGELERQGAVDTSQSNDGNSGRPRKIYRAVF
ncbi:hypothetical protein EK0264_03280 [Epidermidibacterium keratini]|uniref:ATP-binding protein n=1 Tax=Epidermidibacterium keratini TaxID=1891644 RepID=A0A7L4YKQ4_9ACTN|nr:hypothetical protein [Epidermidibacterium keratini]QHB99398.1 hypothetical protein EK0264_03280 [Epidermidibacterium keratini]